MRLGHPTGAADATILDRILAAKREEVAARRAGLPLAELEARLRDAPPPRDFVGALARPAGPGARGRSGPVRFIAEIKRASPSKGRLREPFDPAALARGYEAGGARALSVLTDGPFFRGSLDDLAAARAATGLPTLRKDFLLDPYQVAEARAAGADAVLLIARALAPDDLRRLLAVAEARGLPALVEVHTRPELEAALAAGARVVGINNRDLDTFRTDLGVSLTLLADVPPDRIAVSESGIAAREEAARLARAGADALLVGEGLLRHADVAAALRRLRPDGSRQEPSGPRQEEGAVGGG
jgi:indole-3-glycerol phosphate synthase